MAVSNWDTLYTDVLILGSGGAGLCAALHLAEARPSPAVIIAVKGLYGKSGCTRMVQGGYNVVLRQPDSLEAHFRDTLEGGQWINHQELAWTLVREAPNRILELENRVGCFFDRNPDGSVHQKPFAGQSHDRTVHKGDLTGIEIINRLSEQVAALEPVILEETRGVELILDESGGRVIGALLVDLRRGSFVVVRAGATLLATGGGPTMFKITAASHDKSCDGVAMGFRVGAELMDMEMVQFHPTGLLVGQNQISGTVLEEGLRGAGALLLNGEGERYMERYDPRLERATRDVVSRSSYMEIMAGRGTVDEGVLLDISHRGSDFVEKNFPGMTRRCRDVGFDLAREPVTVSPTAHFNMGGIAIDPECHTSLEGLYAAGEDASGAHGANRLGGNGVAESTVFGGIAGDVIARELSSPAQKSLDKAAIEEMIKNSETLLLRQKGPSVFELRDRMRESMWRRAGVVRNREQLEQALLELEELRNELSRVGCPGGPVYNLAWNTALNMENSLDVSEAIVRSALARQESRGSHYRSDFPEQNNREYLCNFTLSRSEPAPRRREVVMARMAPPS